MLRLVPGLLALRTAIGVIDPLGLALLDSCLPSPLSILGTTTRAFSGYRAVLGTRSLQISAIYLVFYNLARLLSPPVAWNEGCWGVYIPSSVVSRTRQKQPITSESTIQVVVHARTVYESYYIQLYQYSRSEAVLAKSYQYTGTTNESIPSAPHERV